MEEVSHMTPVRPKSYENLIAEQSPRILVSFFANHFCKLRKLSNCFVSGNRLGELQFGATTSRFDTGMTAHRRKVSLSNVFATFADLRIAKKPEREDLQWKVSQASQLWDHAVLYPFPSPTAD